MTAPMTPPTADPGTRRIALTVAVDWSPATLPPDVVHDVAQDIARALGAPGAVATTGDEPMTTVSLMVPVRASGTLLTDALDGLEDSARRCYEHAFPRGADATVRVVDIRACDVERIHEEATAALARPDVVGVDEFRGMLGVGRAQLYRLRERPDFPAQLPIRGAAWSRADAERFVASYRAEAASPAGVAMCGCGAAHPLGTTACPNLPGAAR